MSHLIKLEDYISRYQFDIFRYPNQFTRLKKERWESVRAEWANRRNIKNFHVEQLKDEEQEKETNIIVKTFKKLKKLPFFNNEQTDAEVAQFDPYQYDPILRAKTYEELKSVFMDEIFQSQLRWASSSVLEKSYLNPRYKYDTKLKFFATQIPDNYLLMYRPVFFIKHARIDMDVILISPTEVYCITMLDGTDHSIFTVTQERFWVETVDTDVRKVISPMIQLNRMAKIVSDILKENDLKVPVKKVLLSPLSYLDNQVKGLTTELVDRRNFEQWKEKIRRHPSPIKKDQLNVAKVLLDQCQTKAFKRQDILNQDQEALQQEDDDELRDDFQDDFQNERGN